MVTRENVCAPIENHTCSIAGTAYTFRVHSASISLHPGDRAQGIAVLEVHAFAHGRSVHLAAATVRITAPLNEVVSLPVLLTKALSLWIVKSATDTAITHLRAAGMLALIDQSSRHCVRNSIITTPK
jgi:hypothetical protein